MLYLLWWDECSVWEIDKFVGINTMYICQRQAAEAAKVGRTHPDGNYKCQLWNMKKKKNPIHVI